ncbi:acyl-CoA dehydrogenase family protein [Streptomyces sp. AcE210]|uniref:acyl-CoA dehydrogenase family protein n=1 Tax=Streptomyces sp. AcE210 TaxID=2292703 RepID=UPI000E307191|nr:acyl-CoA dehydrogenase family protein [Streptomyces sp. AcE210]RFC70797.1 acyl-CoA dehydrogenase family protein [Streptomyces sp. AcE210]
MIDPEVFALGFDDYLARVAELTDDVLIPAEAEMVAAGSVPDHVLRALAHHGLFAVSIPRRLGGLEWSMTQQVRLTMEFTRASCVYRSRFSTVIGLCSQAILDHGTDEQREGLLPKMAAGEHVTAFALTEPDAGSDAASLTTTARRVYGGWVIDGRKRYITNGHWADDLVVFARTGEAADGAAGVSAFFVPRVSEGVTTWLPERMNGHAEAPVAEIELTGVRVDDSALLGGSVGTGFAAALRGINHARLHVAATCVGQATRMLEETTRHLLGRRQFGAPLADLGAVQADLGGCFADLEAGRALTLAAAEAFDSGRIPRHRIAAAKLFCSEMAGRVADRCVQLLGGEGIVGDNPVPRMWRDVRALRIYEGSSPVHERNLGRAVARHVGMDGTLPDTYRVTRGPAAGA